MATISPVWVPITPSVNVRPDKLYLVTGPSGYTQHTKFLTRAYVRDTELGKDDRYRWLDVTGEPLSDMGWFPHHLSLDEIMLPDPPETPEQTLARLAKENTDLRNYIRIMSQQDQGAGGNVSPEELGRVLLEMARKGTAL